MKNKKKILILFKEEKINSLKKIDQSICEWERYLKKYYFFRQFLKIDKSLFWEQSKKFSKFYNVHLKWSSNIVRSQINVEEKDVIKALNGIKSFYQKISTIKPDLSHPDIFRSFDLTARKLNLNIKNLYLKENIEINIIDPFNNVSGRENKKIEKILDTGKSQLLKDLKYSIEYFDNLKNKQNIDNLEFNNKPKNFIKESNNLYCLKLNLFENEIQTKKIPKNKVRKELLSYFKVINSLNIRRPNLNNSLIKRMYIIAKNKINKN